MPASLVNAPFPPYAHFSDFADRRERERRTADVGELSDDDRGEVAVRMIDEARAIIARAGSLIAHMPRFGDDCAAVDELLSNAEDTRGRIAKHVKQKRRRCAA